MESRANEMKLEEDSRQVLEVKTEEIDEARMGREDMTEEMECQMEEIVKEVVEKGLEEDDSNNVQEKSNKGKKSAQYKRMKDRPIIDIDDNKLKTGDGAI